MRFALNKLEIASFTVKENEIITKEMIEDIVKKANTTIDKNEDGHYDAVSALQKSIRGSDVDAALYYLARLIAADDLDSIERRLIVTAYEDVGLANPAAVDRTYNAIQTARMVGFPEASIPLGFAVVELALSPKSKSAYQGIHSALDLVNSHTFHVPEYLRLTPVGLKEEEKYKNGEFETEAEYNQAMTDAKNYYYEKLGQYANLYYISVEEDQRIIAEAWSS